MGKKKVVTNKIAALGRPFRIGCLYDCRSDKLISDQSLWDSEVLQYIKTNPSKSVKTDIISIDSISQKFQILEFGIGQKVNVLAGFQVLKGAAQYLLHHMSSIVSNGVAVRYRYHSKTLLLPDEMVKMYQWEKNRQIIGSHVVTGIEYGGHAVVLLENPIGPTSKRDLTELAQNLLCERPALMDSDAICHFYSDFSVTNKPMSYSECADKMQKLESIQLSAEDKPLTIHLYPLSEIEGIELSGKFKEISDEVVAKLECQFELIDKIRHECTEHRIGQGQITFSTTLSTLESRLDTFKQFLQRDMIQLIPQIRSGDVEENILEKALLGRCQSPFNEAYLRVCVRELQRREQLIKDLRQMLANVKTLQPDETFKPPNKTPTSTFIFNVYINKTTEHIHMMDNYLEDGEHTGGEILSDQHELYSTRIRQTCNQFKQFFDDNKSKVGLFFSTANTFLIGRMLKAVSHITAMANYWIQTFKYPDHLANRSWT